MLKIFRIWGESRRCLVEDSIVKSTLCDFSQGLLKLLNWLEVARLGQWVKRVRLIEMVVRQGRCPFLISTEASVVEN